MKEIPGSVKNQGKKGAFFIFIFLFLFFKVMYSLLSTRNSMER